MILAESDPVEPQEAPQKENSKQEGINLELNTSNMPPIREESISKQEATKEASLEQKKDEPETKQEFSLPVDEN